MYRDNAALVSREEYKAVLQAAMMQHCHHRGQAIVFYSLNSYLVYWVFQLRRFLVVLGTHVRSIRKVCCGRGVWVAKVNWVWANDFNVFRHQQQSCPCATKNNECVLCRVALPIRFVSPPT